MPLILDESLEFVGLNHSPSRCQVRLFTPSNVAQESGYIVILTEDEDAEGTSITNAVEQLAAILCGRFHVPEECVAWIEHYNYRNWAQGHDGGGHEQLFAVATFAALADEREASDYIHGTSLGRPMWRHIDRQNVEIMIGEPLPKRPWPRTN